MTQTWVSYWRAVHPSGGVNKHGVHIRRHMFCPRLAMINAPMKSIQELEGMRT